MVAPVSVSAPPEGFWRVARGPDPLSVRYPDPKTLLSSRTGNRFDSAGPDYGVLYFGTTLETCFGEVLARLRPSPHLIAVVQDEWHEMNFMGLGSVPAEWRQLRTAARVVASPEARFLDVEALATHQYLRSELALGLSAMGYNDLDVSILRGPDRRVTRLISEWAYNATQASDDPTPVYAGVRYLSRLSNEWECWAVFEDTDLAAEETMPITQDLPALKTIAEGFGLTVH